ncbi:unnamed protein product (macronuclear) [Paramecium tetraurelia]|uniref:Protein kinase domain-containing protein n=1 Tax=Paramecium tetraurelia TaxID=5888 RepID=A0D4T0_PARTE|nr:uncharacterized protein GSPATT00013494001 [Paramecium tetraurelia]CAK78047.1 unnamed protein product [Paramecium tetraurelia]|eukprot:XP_001445444.1 hypothetical protein (macronuclear) [Paramecium tetraurelia strain d4-2]
MNIELTKDDFYRKYSPLTKLNLNDQPFTIQYKSRNENEVFWIKKRRIQGQYQDYFIEEIRNEIKIQTSLNNKNCVLEIKNFTIFQSENKNRKVVMIAYYNDDKCAPILKYIKNQAPGIERKIFVSKRLLEVYNILRSSNVFHQNIKPNNVFFYDNDIFFSDFGSNRTFHQNYIQQFDRRSEQNWQKDYYFYNPKIILDIIQNLPDYDMRIIEFDNIREQMKRQKQFEDVLNVPQNSFNLDAWAIGVIIIQIFYPKDYINPPIETFYALQKVELDKKINEITLIDSQIGQGLQMLFYPENQRQQQQQQQPYQYNVQLNISQKFPTSVIVQQGQLSTSSIITEFNRTFPNPVTCCKAKVTKYGTIQAMDKFLQLVQKQIYPELGKFFQQNNEQKLWCFLDFHMLLQLDLKEVQSYLDDLMRLLIELSEISQRETSQNEAIQQSHKNNIEKLKENIFLVENRKQALQYFYNYEMEAPEEDIIYYYNLKEANILQWKKQFQIPDEVTDQLTNIEAKPYFSPKKIAGLIKLRKKELKIEAQVPVKLSQVQQKIISIYYLKGLPEYKDTLEKKEEEKKKYGAEQFPFNLALRTRQKAQAFINEKQLKYLLGFEEYQSISAKLKSQYLKTLFSCIDIGIKNKQDVQQFISGVNHIYPSLKYKFRQKYAEIMLTYGMLPSELCEEIQMFFEQKYSVRIKVDYKYLDYLKEFGSIQIKKNYIGYLVNDKPHGQGFQRINQETLQFGIFKYGQIIWGWEIVKAEEKKILLYKGEFQNGRKTNRGINKAYENEQNGGQSIFKYLKP